MGELAGKVVLVTGGGGGLGRAIVRRFLSEGAAVTVLERSRPSADALAEDLGDESLHIVVGDAASPRDNQNVVEQAVAQFGRLDIFVGNAGIYDNRAALADLTLDDLDAAFDELFAVNVKGYLLGVRAALDPLRQTRGCVVLTGSLSSQTAGFGGSLYVASKHAIVGLVRQLAWELAPDVRVNGVAPGYVPTGLQGLSSLGQGRSVSGLEPEALPLGEICTADDYAELYLFLVSAAGRVATGALFSADGGLSVAGPAFKGWNS